jgi:hypothetical protein
MLPDEILAPLDQLESLGFQFCGTTYYEPDFGVWNHNEKITVVVDELGTIYVRKGPTKDPESLDLIRRICKRGRGNLPSQFVREIYELGEVD